MKFYLLAVALCCFGSPARAQEHAYPAKSWAYNVDFKDPDALSPFIGRELVEGQWKGGADWSPLSLYHIDDAAGTATRWATFGAFLVTNAERLNASFGPSLGLDVLRWTSQSRISGPLGKAAKLWKPLGLASVTVSVNAWGGWTPIHTDDVLHNYCGGYGFKLKAVFGAGTMDASNALLKGGL